MEETTNVATSNTLASMLPTDMVVLLSKDIVVTIIIVALIALILGFLIGKMTGGSPQKALSSAQVELDEYKDSVSQHFGKTADLVDNLTQSYKDVFDHLNTSAKDLLTEEQVKAHLESRAAKVVTLSYTAEQVAKIDTQPVTECQQDNVEKTPSAEIAEEPKKVVETVDVEEIEKKYEENPNEDAVAIERAVVDDDGQEKTKTNEEKSAELLNEVAQKINDINETKS